MLMRDARTCAYGKIVINIILIWMATSSVVLGGLAFGRGFVENKNVDKHKVVTYEDMMTRFDGVNYRNIVDYGYNYNANRRSTVAFFPLYPMLAAVFSIAFNINTSCSLIVVSNLATLACFFLLYIYSRDKLCSREESFAVLIVFGLMPTGLFIRMAYTESLMCAIVLVTLIGFSRHWPYWLLAVVAGFATATRPVGVSLAAAVCYYSLVDNGTWKVRLVRALYLAPLSCWGLLAYMTFLFCKFDNPLAFASTQVYWTFASPVNSSLADKMWSLMTLEPIWSVYDPGSPRHWQRHDHHLNPMFCLLFWNPIFVLFHSFLVIYGFIRKWLFNHEVILCILLLIIPYVTRAYEMSMASHARFTLVIVPAYVLVIRACAVVPRAVMSAIFSILAFFLFIWSSLYGTQHLFF